MARRPAKPQRPPLTPFYLVLGLVALVGLGVILYQVLGGGGTAATEPVPVEIDEAELARVQGIGMGREDAPVVIYEFADFQCPGCAGFASFVAPLIKQRLVDPGLVRYVYYDYPLTQIHPHAFLASRAGRCANEQGRFWEYHDRLYARQATWAAMGDPTDFFIDLAADAGLDRGQFADCLRSDRYAEEVTRNMRLGEALGVPGTPTLFVNMKRLDQIPSFAELEALVRAEAGQAAAGDGAAGPVEDTVAEAAPDTP